MLFFGTVLFVEANYYGFIAPVLAARAPALLDAANAYAPVATLNGLLSVGFFPGVILFGVAMLRARVFPRQAGILMAIGAPLFLVGGALGQLVLEALWTVAILGALAVGLGLAWAGAAIWSGTVSSVAQPTRL